MIWWLNFFCAAFVLVLSLWAVLDQRVKTRVSGTVAFSALGVFASLLMRGPLALVGVPQGLALLMSMGVLGLAIALLMHYIESSLFVEQYEAF
jgi:hypothetical protein